MLVKRKLLALNKTILQAFECCLSDFIITLPVFVVKAVRGTLITVTNMFSAFIMERFHVLYSKLQVLIADANKIFALSLYRKLFKRSTLPQPLIISITNVSFAQLQGNPRKCFSQFRNKKEEDVYVSEVELIYLFLNA